MKQTNHKLSLTLAAALMVVGGGGLVSARQAYVKDAAAKTTAQQARNIDLLESYASKAQELSKGKRALAPARVAKPQTRSEAEEIFYEDFSRLTSGNEEEAGVALSSYVETGDTSIDDSKFSFPGWWGIGVYEAGGAVALTYPRYGGVLTTGPMNLFGNLHVSMRVKAHSSNNDNPVPFIVSIIYGDAFNPQPATEYSIINISKSDGWKDIELNFKNPINTDDCRVQINAAFGTNGILVDDLRVTRDDDICLPPALFGYTDFDNDGFTAYWEPGAGCDYYLVDLKSEEELDDAPIEVVEDFENVSVDGGLVTGVPESWYCFVGDGDVIAEDKAGKGLVFDNWDFLEIDGEGGRFYEFQFFLKPNVTADSFARLEVLGSNGGEFQSLADIYLQYLDEYGQSIDLMAEIRSLALNFSKIMIEGHDFAEGESCVIDDIYYATTPRIRTTQVITSLRCDKPEVRFSGLDPALEYFYSVTGMKENGMKSEPSGYVHALGLPTPEVTEPASIDFKGSYIACWNPSPKAVGYWVNNYAASTVAEDTPAFALLSDSFSNANEEGGYLDGTSFDGIADNVGWMSQAGLIDNGMIGTFQKPLYTPELFLNNNDGRFTVKMKVRGFGDEIVQVRSYNDTQTVDFLELNPDGDFMEMYDHELTFEFEDGHPHQRIEISGLGYGTILIDDFQVIQDLKAGDEVYTYLQTLSVAAPATEAEFEGLDPSKTPTYAYNVRAIGNYYGEMYISDYSDLKKVNLDGSVVEGIGLNTYDMTVAAVAGGISVKSAVEGEAINVYSLTGMKVATAKADTGETIIPMEKGIYVVETSTAKTKVIVSK